jgi:hypothetical protein
MMATTETLRSVLRTSRGQPILKLQSAEQRASLALSSFAGKPRGTGGLVPVVGQRPARALRQSRRARSFLGNIRAIFGLRGQGKCVRTSMDDALSRHGRDGAGAPIWRHAGTRTRSAVGGFRQRGPALRIRFSHGDLIWDQVAIRLLRIRCDVLRPISESRRLESMDRRLFTVMLQWQSALPPSLSEATHGPWHEMPNGHLSLEHTQRGDNRGDNSHEGDCGNGPGRRNGGDEAGGATRAAGSDKRRRRSGLCVGIHLG